MKTETTTGWYVQYIFDGFIPEADSVPMTDNPLEVTLPEGALGFVHFKQERTTVENGDPVTCGPQLDLHRYFIDAERIWSIHHGLEVHPQESHRFQVGAWPQIRTVDGKYIHYMHATFLVSTENGLERADHYFVE